MEPGVLLIDDDPHLLSALRRQLGDRFDITTACGGEEGVERVRAAASPFGVVLSDMRMPGIDGIETLRRIRDHAPDTVRMMLTGNADQQTAIDAINQGAIFRFYTKPCPSETLIDGLAAGLEQFRLVTAERDLLEQTLTGVIQVLVEVMSVNDPAAAAQAARLREWVRLLTTEFRMPHRWQLEIAAALAPIGMVAMPPAALARLRQGEAPNPDERAMLDRVPEAGRNLLARIPRLARVAEIVHWQDRGYDGSGFPADGPVGADLPLDARLLKILKDLLAATAGGPLTAASFEQLERQRQHYDPVLLPRVRGCLEGLARNEVFTSVALTVGQLQAGHVLAGDLRLGNGHLIFPAHTQLQAPQIERIRTLARVFSFAEPIRVRG
ncbi:HD domain-containing phosphohydrolase [Phaeospirillum tilakii]|uniref:HD domain-containing phosphohydrolase n=1 Tax=Phaeospirillum tilakii TaxID=741673 RepID=A0ABW5CAN1_9PROT